MDFNLDTTYGYNNDIHKSKIINDKPNNLSLLYQMILVLFLLTMLISD